MIGDLSDFLDYARDRLTNSDDPLPCAPEDCAAVMGYLCALVPEYQLTRQAEATDGETRRIDRRQAILNGFRRARSASGNGGSNGSNGGNAANGSSGGTAARPRLLPAPGHLAADDDDAGEAA